MDELDERRIVAKRKKMEELEAGNIRSYNEYGQSVLENFGSVVEMNTSDTRMAALTDALKKFLPEEVYLDFEIDFHTRVENQLNAEWVKLREALAEKAKPKLQVMKQPAPQILGPNGQPLS